MKDVQFKILCPSEMTRFMLCILITELDTEFDIDPMKIRLINMLDVTYEIIDLSAEQSSKIIQAFSDNGYAVSAVEMKETKHAK